MKSDPKECLYCQNNETLHNLMIEFAELSVSRVFCLKSKPTEDVVLYLIKTMSMI